MNRNRIIIVLFALGALVCIAGIIIVFGGILSLEPYKALGIWLAIGGLIAMLIISIFSSIKKTTNKR